MSNNNSNFSISINTSNSSISTDGNGPSVDGMSSRSSVPDLIQVPILSLTILLSMAYTILILARPTFRANKINWFTINLCLMSALLSIDMLAMGIKRLSDSSNSSMPCRLQGFLQNMATCQLIYSHVVITVSRLLTIVYATKRFFRSTIFLFGCLASGWLTAFLVPIPYLLVDGFACSSTTRADFLTHYSLAFTLLIPVMIVLILNIWIFLFLRQSSKRVHAEGVRAGVSHARDIHLLKIMIATFTVFVVGWVPLFITQIFSQTITISSVADGIFQVLPPLSMLCDVILLIYINQPVRLFLRQLIVKQNRVKTVKTLAATVKVNPQLH